jgi:large subunit ribosomal protein L19
VSQLESESVAKSLRFSSRGPLSESFFMFASWLLTSFPYLRRPKFSIMNHAVAFVHEQLTNKKSLPKFKAGDNVTVNYRIIEGNKERIQSFRGDVIKLQGEGATATFTVRKISDNVGVERLFPFFSPNIESVVLNKSGRVRRAKLFYQRERSGKSARIQEKKRAVASKTA